MTPARPLWLAILILWALLIVGPLAAVLPILLDDPWHLVQDDGRHFVTWLRELDNPALFPDDPMAEFFRAVTPPLYEALFWPAAAAGIDAVQWHILVLIPGIMLLNILALDRFVALFETDPVLRLAKLVVFTGVMYGSFDAGLPRDFAPAIVCLSIVAFLRGYRWMLCWVMAFGASMYPAAAITVGAGLAAFEALRTARRLFENTHAATLFVAALFGAAGLALFNAGVGDLGPSYSLAEARDLPIFQEGGRTSYFVGDSPVERMTCGNRAGLFDSCGPDRLWWLAYPVHVLVLVCGSIVLTRQRKGDWRLFAGLCLGGLALFGTATAIAFDAHLPARYAKWSVQFVALFLAVVLVVSGLQRLVTWVNAPRYLVPLACGILFLANDPDKVRTFNHVVHDEIPRISAALRHMPVETLIAGVSQHVDNMPAFAERSVWASLELAVPYKKDYHAEMARRVSVLKDLFEESDPDTWRRIHDTSGIDMYLVARTGEIDKWSASFQRAPMGSVRSVFDVFSAQVEFCTVARERDVALVDGNCFSDAISER